MKVRLTPSNLWRCRLRAIFWGVARVVGILVDDELGRSALHAASDDDMWIGRPIEQSGVFPLALCEEPDIGSRLAEWPVNHCVRFWHPAVWTTVTSSGPITNACLPSLPTPAAARGMNFCLR